VKPNINSVEVHPQLSNKGHPVDGVLVSAGLVAPCPQVANSSVKTPYYVPKILPMPVALAKNCDQHLWKEKFL